MGAVWKVPTCLFRYHIRVQTLETQACPGRLSVSFAAQRSFRDVGSTGLREGRAQLWRSRGNSELWACAVAGRELTSVMENAGFAGFEGDQTPHFKHHFIMFLALPRVRELTEFYLIIQSYNRDSQRLTK